MTSSDPWTKPDPVARQREHKTSLEDYLAWQRGETPMQRAKEAVQQAAERRSVVLASWLVALALGFTACGFALEWCNK